MRVTLENLRKEFGNLVAVNDLNLEVKDKHFVSFLGPSGCGKTTTLRMIAGLLSPTKGKIYFDDVDVTETTPQERKVGLVFQDYAVFPHMNAYDNIAWGLKIRKVSKREVKSKVNEVAELLNIKDVLSSMPRSMNQSELQRVALARTLVTNPSVLLLDEPLSNLDAALRARMRAELKRLQLDIQQTVIYVTHDQIEAMSMSDMVAVMNLGILQQYGSPEEIYNYPSNRFVAGFIGSPPMNFIDVTLEEEDGKFYLNQGTFKIDVTKYGKLIKEGASGPNLTLGIRPEHLFIEVRETLKTNVKAMVFAVEPIGPESIVDVTIGGDTIRVIASDEVSSKLEKIAYIGFDLNKIHVIDKRTDKVIV